MSNDEKQESKGLSKSSRQGRVLQWPLNTGWGLQVSPVPVLCQLREREQRAARAVFRHLKRSVEGFPNTRSCPSLGFTIRTWFLLVLRLLSRLSCYCLPMGSCYSLPPKSHLKPLHPGKLTGEESFLVKRIPICLNSSCNIIPWLRVTKPSWKHHLCARLQDSFSSTWSLGRRVRIHKSRATSPLLSLLFQPFLKVS